MIHQQSNIPPPYARGRRVENIPSDILTWDGWSPIDCLNLDPPPPSGWFSIPHWFALLDWRLFDDLPEPGKAICLDLLCPELAEEARAMTLQEGVEPIVWPAPPKLTMPHKGEDWFFPGVATVLLFPDGVLRELDNII